MEIKNRQSKDPKKICVTKLFRSPTLETVDKVERTIKKHSGKYTKRKIWEKLPKKIMWGTYLHILDYLQDISKIAITKKGIVIYIRLQKGRKIK
jgi:hypothetical protein